MKNQFLILLLFSCNQFLFAQNLLPNGSFEQSGSIEGLFPFQTFEVLEIWYPSGQTIIGDTLLDGTPDFFDDNFPVPRTEPPSFWNKERGASDGDKYIGLVGVFQYEGYIKVEAIGSPLSEPLEAGALYHVELDVRNMGTSNNGGVPEFCVPLEYKNMNVFFDTDSIFVYNDPDAEFSFSSSPLVLSLIHDELKGYTLGKWETMGSCFMAEGGENHFAISMRTGDFTVEPPCVFQDLYWKIFYNYYYNVDNIKVVKLPESITIPQEVCFGRPTEINIAELVDFPAMQNEIVFTWDDGTIGETNTIAQTGTYQIDAQIDCGNIPITLEVNEIKCNPHIFVPNTFTPNGDGNNDVLETFITVELPVVDYKFTVFDRYGGLIFSTTDRDNFWNGTFNGQILDNGVYVWLMEYTIDDLEKGITPYQASGDVLLLSND